MIHPTLSVGDRVVLDVPENPYLDGKEGKVKMVTEYGALIATDAAATGEFRAYWSEMTMLRDAADDDTVVETLDKYKGSVKPLSAVDREKLKKSSQPSSSPQQPPPSRNGESSHNHMNNARQARDTGYTGDICSKCGSTKMIRTGSCLCCMECGESGGCV